MHVAHILEHLHMERRRSLELIYEERCHSKLLAGSFKEAFFANPIKKAVLLFPLFHFFPFFIFGVLLFINFFVSLFLFFNDESPLLY
jgi:hypothetical protein